jgi:diaminopropionate ammonia-lyase
MEAGHIVTIPGPHDSAMAGLNCGEPSSVAWPEVSGGVDLFVAVEDQRAFDAVRRMAEAGLVSGETGAAGLAGLLELLAGDGLPAREMLAVGHDDRVLLISTEGATDPEAYRRIVGR